MTTTRLRLLIWLSVASIVGIVAVQAVWVWNAYALRERQFRQSAFIALQDVADNVARLNRFRVNRPAVTGLSSDYFVVNTDAPIDPVTLEVLIQNALRTHGLLVDFEYGIYNCETDCMVYGAYVRAGDPDSGKTSETRGRSLPKFGRSPYYFGIRFPNQTGFVAGQLSGWLWSTGAVLIVVLFFGYTLSVVLRQRRLTETQREFINNMTHELQTPVSSLRITADVLQTKAIWEQPERLRQYVGVLDKESRRLQQHVNNVLQLARLTHERPVPGGPERTVVDLHEVVRAAAGSFAPHVHLHLTAPDARVRANAAQLETVLTNLLDNALKYTVQPPRVVLRTDVVGSRLIWSVSDNGIGIAPEQHAAVFRQFYRVPISQPNAVPGFGLGLHYVRRVARLHGWQLTLQSEPGQGSTFRFSAPLAGTSQTILRRSAAMMGLRSGIRSFCSFLAP